jgi:tricarballylate dehydrogenase
MAACASTTERYDVLVVGAGNAAFSAAHAARERGARVGMLEKAPREWLGGNSYFTAGAFRTVYDGLDDLRPLLEDLDEQTARRVVLPPYRRDDFAEDMRRVTHGRCDPHLTRILIDDSAEVVRWLHGKGLRWRLMFERQSYEVDGEYRFWGGLTIGTVGGGQGLIRQHLDAARRDGIEIAFATPVTGLIVEDGAVRGARCRANGAPTEILAGAVVIAAGGFESNPLMRAQYLGPRWDIAKVRGTPYNTGEVLRMALDAGAQPFGHWSGSHAIAWDAEAPDHGDLELTNRLSRQGYPLGIVVNTDAERFLDEGADLRNYTYARYGAAILEQPGGLAYQLFDAKTRPLLSEVDYGHEGIAMATSDSIAGLAEQVGLDAQRLCATVDEFNASTRGGAFNPAIRDGVRTVGIKPPKSNWAQPLDTPPFYAFPVSCGLTFTFGGVKIDEQARVVHESGAPIPGLMASGELVGGLFFHNYPGGSGLTAGAVFGRRAGMSAAAYALDRTTTLA